jgi:HPt (histidine-containing phosphotransfer) domain-containing protein
VSPGSPVDELNTGRTTDMSTEAIDKSSTVDDQPDARRRVAGRAEPIEARLLLNFLRSRTTGLAAQEQLSEVREWTDLHDEDVDQELMDRLQEMYLDALPDRLQAIASGTRSGNAPAVMSAAHTLAGTSGQLGHPDVAAVCQAIAADARRGVMAPAKVVELQELARS